jgi:hypothetical protein
MQFTFRCVVALGLVGLTIAGCSSDKDPTAKGNGEEGLGSGGKGSGGKAASTASGGAPVLWGAADTKGDGCRKCLAGACCSDYTACIADAPCNKALDAQAACAAEPGSELSTCFGALARSLYGDSGDFPPLLQCFVTQCSAICGGPGAV